MKRFAERGHEPLRRSPGPMKRFAERGYKPLRRSLGPTPSLLASPIEAEERAAIPRELALGPSGGRAQKRPRARRTSRSFAIRSFSIGVLPRNEPGRSCGGSGRRVPLSGSRRSRGPRSRAVFLDQGLSCPIPRCRGGRPQRALALRNARTPRKQNSDGLVVPSPALRRRVALFMALSAFNLRIGRGDGRNRRGLTRRPIRVRDILVNSVD